jgi:hypothetical protein
VSIRPAQVRFYIDADILGFGQLVASLRNDVTYPGDPGAQIHKRVRPPCPIRENGAKMVALNQRDASTKWGQLEVFMTQWRRIEALAPQPGPFIWRVSRTAMTAIPLD